MASAVPKQFVELAGIPILMRTIARFASLEEAPQIVVVLPPSQIETWKVLCAKHSFTKQHLIAAGGEERFHSVRNGLILIDDPEALVAVHDGVRPLVSAQVIERSYQTAQLYGAAIPTVQPTDSVRIIDGTDTKSISRSNVMLVQTPQTFRADILKKAYQQAFSSDFTDDASVVEASGVSIYTFDGERTNIKITTQHDLLIADCLLQPINGHI